MKKILRKPKKPTVSWSPEEDEKLVFLLAEELEKGANLKYAADYASSKLDERTSNGILFRWYNFLSKNLEYKQLIDEAKKLGKGKQYLIDSNEGKVEEQIQFTDNVKNNMPSAQDIKNVKEFIDNVATVVEENRLMKLEIEELKYQLNSEQKVKQQLIEDNKAYAKIFDKAREMAVSEEAGERVSQNSKFRMDRNGNLERY